MPRALPLRVFISIIFAAHCLGNKELHSLQKSVFENSPQGLYFSKYKKKIPSYFFYDNGASRERINLLNLIN